MYDAFKARSFNWPAMECKYSNREQKEQHGIGQDEQNVCKDRAGMLMHLPIFLQRSSPLLCMIIGE